MIQNAHARTRESDGPALREASAIGAGVLQMIVGLILAFLSIESIGLVSDEDFSLIWPLAVPSFIVLATIGFTVALIAHHPRWFRIGVLSIALAFAAALVASFVLGSAAVGILLFAIMQLVLPSLLANVGSRARHSHPSDVRRGLGESSNHHAEANSPDRQPD